MEREKYHSQAGLLIQGDFTPGKEPKVLKIFIKVLSIVLCIGVVSSLAIYGMTVHYANAINTTGQKTRQLNEMNKELTVKLNHIQSYKNIEVAAESVPQLHLSEEILEVMKDQSQHLPSLPPREKEFPRVSGY
ncbi:MAG: hypothetical protein K2X66_03015 [Cyanobacteria bacterium]|nr:hypothetical protein [Cyanobacteriota bacterium]